MLHQGGYCRDLEIAGRMIVAVEEKGCGYWLRRELTGLISGRATLCRRMNGMGVQNKNAEMQKSRVYLENAPSNLKNKVEQL